MKTHHGNRIAAVLAQNVGREQAITATAICHELGWPESRARLVRQIIASESALWPVLVCGVPGAGFFVAQDIEEAAQYDSWLADLATLAQAKVTDFRESARRIGFRFPLPTDPAPAVATGPATGQDFLAYL